MMCALILNTPEVTSKPDFNDSLLSFLIMGHSRKRTLLLGHHSSCFHWQYLWTSCLSLQHSFLFSSWLIFLHKLFWAVLAYQESHYPVLLMASPPPCFFFFPPWKFTLHWITKGPASDLHWTLDLYSILSKETKCPLSDFILQSHPLQGIFISGFNHVIQTQCSP